MILQSLARKQVAQPTVLFLLISLFLWSCNPNSASKTEASVNEYKGEDLFRGIMFADGKIADLVPEIKKMKSFIAEQPLNAQEKEAIKSLQDSLLYKIQEADPDYLKTFKANIQSGDQVLVASTIRTASILLSTILYENNKGLAPLLDNTQNELFKKELKDSKAYEKLITSKDSLISNPKQLKELLATVNKDLKIDRGVYINNARAINLNTSKALNVNKAINTDRSLAVNKNIDVFNFLSKNLQTHFDKVNINRATDVNSNPSGSVAVDIETFVYAVVAVAVFLVVTIAWMPGNSDILNDKGNLYNDQLVNSITVNLGANQKGLMK